MIIKIDNVENGFSKEFSFCKSIPLPNNQNSLTSVTGTVTNSYGQFIVNSSVCSTISSVCDCCLEEVSQNINFDMMEIFSKEPSEDERIWNFPQKDNFFDISQAVYTNILLNLPMKTLCSSECKGLCFKCGHNLNFGECGCERHFINSRFEKFLNLLKEE